MNIAKYLPLLALLALAGCDISSNEPPPDLGIAAAEQAVKRILIDPESAQFSGISRNSETGAYCGYVNAKNRLGGYTGDKRFAFNNGRVVFFPDPADLDRKILELQRTLENTSRGSDAAGRETLRRSF
jgi:hypothetical protein